MLCRRPGLVADRGANMLEYVGITIVVAGVIVALAMTTVPSDIQAGFANGVCRIVNPGDPDCKKGGATASPGPDASGDPTTTPTDASSGSPTTGPGEGDPSSEYDDAKKAADEAAEAESDAEEEWGKIDEALLDLVADLVGWNSAKDCFTKGDIGACLETLLTAIPWGKLFKAAKMIPKIWKLFRRFKKLRDKLTKARKARKKADERLEKAKEACETNSFVPGTRVLMADGGTAPIEDVGAGDRVLATAPRTGASGSRAVLGLITGNGTKRLVDVKIDRDGMHGGAASTITATDGHPFWIADAGMWVNAGDLVAGDQLRTSTGEVRTVTATRERTAKARVHNLSVASLRTYYVLAGRTPVLVHNCRKMTSKIGDDSLLSKEAQKAGRSPAVQREMDSLFDQLSKGNMNPGLGTKTLGGTDISYARGRNGARLFFRQVDGGIEVVGKADKGNESKVIKRLQELYG